MNFGTNNALVEAKERSPQVKARTIFFIIVILAMSMMTKVYRNLKSAQIPEDSTFSFNVFGKTVSPYSIGQKEIEKDRQKLQASLSRVRQSGLGLNGRIDNILSAKNETSAVTGRGANSKLADDKTKKKKKKKKKKGNTEFSNIAQSEPEAIDTDLAKNSKDKKTADLEPVFYTEPLPVAQPAPAEEKKVPVTYEDWAQLVLGRPQPENVSKLVQYFNTNIVNAEVFYALLTAMSQENNPQQKLLAVGAAGKASNPRSFSFLVEVIRSEPQNSPIANEANTTLASYQELTKMDDLKSVMQTYAEDDQIILVAAQTLDASTLKYIEQRRGPSAENPDSPPASLNDIDLNAAARRAQEQLLALRQSYSGFDKILPSLLESFAGNAEISRLIQASLDRIRTIIIVDGPRPQ